MIRVAFIWLVSIISLSGQSDHVFANAEALYDKGKDLYYQSEYDLAIKVLDSCLVYGYTHLPEDSKLLVRAEQRLANAAMRIRRYNLSETHLRKALDLAKKIYGEESERVAGICNDFGILFSRKGLYSQSQKWNSRAMDIQSKIFGSASLEVSFTRMNNAFNFYDLGNYSKCLSEYFDVLSIYEKKLDPDNENYNRAYLGMSNAFRKRGDLENALVYAKKALNVKLKNYPKDHPSVRKYYTNVAKALVAVGNLEEAKIYFDKARKIVSNYGSKRDLGNLINDAARVYLATGQFEEALHDFRQAEILLADSEDKLVITRYNISSCLYQLGQKERALELVESLENVEFQAERWLRLAKWSYEMDYKEKAKRYFLKGRASIPKGDDLLSAEFDYVEAQMLFNENLAESWELVNRSMDGLVQIRRNYTGSESRDFINDELEGIFDFAVEVALARYQMDENHVEELFQVVEKAKAASFWDNLSEENASFYGGVPSTFLDEIEILREEGFESQPALIQKLDTLENDYPEYYKIKYALEVPTINEIQRSLETGMVFMDYYVLDSIIINLILAKDEIEVITYKNTGKVDFVAEIAALDSKVSRISIVPHRHIFYLSFDQIIHPESQDPLLYHYAFSYQLNSEEMLHYERKRTSRAYLGFVPDWEGDEVAFGTFRSALVPLPGAKEEVIKVAKLFKGTILESDDASEDNFFRKASSYDILHLATHAQVDPENELNSVLFLDGQDSTGDGRLEMDEIMKSDLDASLVILSACETGAGGLQSGEGVMSLARAFQYAGSESVLMSLWRANDNSASPIIYEFVKNCQKGMPKDIALQRSKISYLENADPLMRSDFYWAGFMINGNLEPLGKSFRLKWYLLSMMGLFCILMIGYRYTSKA